MKRSLLGVMVLILVASAGCTSALTQGDKTSDDAHGFRLQLAQIIDQIDGDVPSDGETFLVIKYEIENLRTLQDSRRQWTEHIKLEATGEYYQAIQIDLLPNQMWATSLAAGEAKTGYIGYAVPEDAGDFRLTLTFPVSGKEETYQFRPVDKRIGRNTDHVLTRLEQIERTKRIPLVGGLLASFSSAPIRYLGTVLVPEEKIAELLEQTRDLPEDARRAVVENYLLERGLGGLE